jgi:hypothetical protein
MINKTVVSFLLIFLLFTISTGATTVTLVGDNSQPGFLNLVVGGTTFSALDYTGQRYAEQGDTWNANIYNFNQLSQAYYSHSDPYIHYNDYQTRYEEDIYLFNLLASYQNPTSSQKQGIQDAVYYISGASGFSSNSYVTQAQTDVAINGVFDLGNLSNYRFVDSPFTDSLGHQVMQSQLIQGFIYSVDGTNNTNSQTPEPRTYILMVSGMLMIIVGIRKRGTA